MYTHEYDRDYLYGPAMPVVELRVRPIGVTGNGIGLQALVDSGADATILPITSNEAILGRDVLNQLIVTLNGLAHVVELSQ